MKTHKVLTDAIEKACHSILIENNHASYVIQQSLLEGKRWGSRDRRFIAETITLVVKNYRKLCFLTEQTFGEVVNFPPIVALAIYLEYNEMADVYKDVVDLESIAKLQLQNKEVKTLYSFPDWMDELFSKDLGKKKWTTEAEASNEKSSTYLRVNTFKSNITDCLENLKKHEIEVEICERVPNCLVLTRRADIRKTEAFTNGWLEIQDAGSQLISLFLNPKKGDKVIDACAGAGGKSLHIADLMQNTGKISSKDVDSKKLKELETRATRNGYTNLKTHVHKNITLNNYTDWADKLLLDVPCSGLGVLKRNPDDKWKLTPERLVELMEIQKTILQDYSVMLKSGGELVYATCSMYSGENQAQIKAFLKANKNFELLEEKQLFPSDGFDGFYMAKLLKK